MNFHTGPVQYALVPVPMSMQQPPQTMQQHQHGHGNGMALAVACASWPSDSYCNESSQAWCDGSSMPYMCVVSPLSPGFGSNHSEHDAIEVQAY
jgi:hypothetical protein